MKTIVLCLLLMLFPATIQLLKADEHERLPKYPVQYTGYSNIAISYNGKRLPYAISSISTLPGTEVYLSSDFPDAEKIWIKADYGIIRKTGQSDWVWNAPKKPGVYPVFITDLKTGDQSTINMFVLTPSSMQKGDFLNGYQIGKYPKEPLRGNPVYLPPKGFIEVTRENMHTQVSPNFKLSQFLCKQEGGFPKYLILSEDLLHQLEYILARVREKGYTPPTLTIMSGYRTPYYNKRIGNGAYSRHIYGDAADIFIDTNPSNGMMDDLNGDGKVNREDARILFDLIEDIQLSTDNDIGLGGLGLYSKRPWRGPFVHVDARGHKARWFK